MGKYTDDFRAAAVVMLQANGYPNQLVLSRISKDLKVPRTTLRRWFEGFNAPPPENVQEKKQELSELFEAEMRAIFREMGSARQDADYRDLGVVLGIVADKLNLLSDKPTDRNELIVRIVRGDNP